MEVDWKDIRRAFFPPLSESSIHLEDILYMLIGSWSKGGRFCILLMKSSQSSSRVKGQDNSQNYKGGIKV